MTASANDEKLARLLDRKNGLALYGAFWRVQEIVAAQIPSGSLNCSVTYSVTRWSLLMSVRGSHVRHYLGQLYENGLLTVQWNDNEITVTSPNLLKYRDEYARKSGHPPDKLPARTELELELEGELENKKKALSRGKREVSKESLEIYSAYPRKVGKSAALSKIEHALKSLASETPARDAKWLLDRVKEFARSETGRGEYCPHPATWFHQGRYNDDPAEWNRKNGQKQPINNSNRFKKMEFL